MIEVPRRRRTKMNAHDFSDFWHHNPHSLFYNPPPPLLPPPNELSGRIDGGMVGDPSRQSDGRSANPLLGDEPLGRSLLDGAPSTAATLPPPGGHCNSSTNGPNDGDHLFGNPHHQPTAGDILDLSGNRASHYLPGVIHSAMGGGPMPPPHFGGPGASPLMMPGASAAQLLAAGFHSGFGGFSNNPSPFTFGLHAAAVATSVQNSQQPFGLPPPPRLGTPLAMCDLDQQRGVGGRVDEPTALRRHAASRSGASSTSSLRSLSDSTTDGMPNLQRIEDAANSSAHLLQSSSAAFSQLQQLPPASSGAAGPSIASSSSSLAAATAAMSAAACAAAASNPLNFVLNNIAAHQQHMQQQHPTMPPQNPQHLLGSPPQPSSSHNLLFPPPPLLNPDDLLLHRGSIGGEGGQAGSGMKTRSNVVQIPHETKADHLGSSAPLCQVCHSGPSNGLHFGAPRTCAACAAFFRRSISDQKKYVCKRPQRCTLRVLDSQGYRKICRNCRMKRCLEIGMMPEKVQHKRHRRDVGEPFTPKNLHASKMERSSSGESPAMSVGLPGAASTSSSLPAVSAEELGRQHYANQVANAAAQFPYQPQQMNDQLLHANNPWASLANPMSSLCNGMPRL